LRGKQIDCELVQAGKIYVVDNDGKFVIARLDRITFSKVSYDDQRIWYTEVNGRGHMEEFSGPSPFFEYLGPEVTIAARKK
jgi:hypothetical protein